MHNEAYRAYQENRILNASPEQLQLMLYEGATRFTHSARTALLENDFEAAQRAFERVDAILVELLAGLRPDLNPDLCEKFASLYAFCSRKLCEANFQHSVALVDEALGILQHLRATWMMVLEQLAAERAARHEDSSEPALAS